jgi:tight adherence protein C
MGTDLMLIVGMLAVGGALMAIVLAVSAGAGQATGVAKSLQLIEQVIDSKEVAKEDLPASERLLKPLLGGTRRLAFRLSPAGTLDKLARMLEVAGNPPAWTVDRILGLKGAALVAGVAGGLYFGGLNLNGGLYALAAGGVGFFLPDLMVYNLGQKRQNELRRGLADALDMLTVCVEAGQGFDAALLQVAKSVDGPVAGEFARVLSEIQIGKSRGEAFASMGQRTTVPAARTFISSLVQADRLGLPIANVLKEQSHEMRLARRQHAEEQAQKVPVKILFPMMFCIFPALFIVIIGPGVIQIMGTFGSA